MDLNIRIIHSKEFLKTTASGTLDFDASKQILLKLAALNEPPASNDILLDLRDSIGRPSIAEVTELVEVMIANRPSFRNKLALLAPPEAPLDRAKFMELYGHNRGIQIRAFKDFEEAINWLTTSTDLTAPKTV